MSVTTMVSTPFAIVVSILFAGAAVFSIARLARSHGPVTRMNYGLHLLMSLAMIAMAWPDTVGTLSAAQVVVFAAATLWFVARSVVRRRRRPELDLYHGAMMGTMTLMVLSMGDHGMSHEGKPAGTLAAAGGFFAVAAVMWAVVLIRRLRGVPPSRLRNRLAGEAVYESAMAAGMAIMAFS